jgi:hypothetical protein
MGPVCSESPFPSYKSHSTAAPPPFHRLIIDSCSTKPTSMAGTATARLLRRGSGIAALLSRRLPRLRGPRNVNAAVTIMRKGRESKRLPDGSFVDGPVHLQRKGHVKGPRTFFVLSGASAHGCPDTCLALVRATEALRNMRYLHNHRSRLNSWARRRARLQASNLQVGESARILPTPLVLPSLNSSV